MSNDNKTQVIKMSQTGHITALFYWFCPHCKTKNCSLGYPDDKEFADECYICKKEVVITA